jgi:hypothetical protein
MDLPVLLPRLGYLNQFWERPQEDLAEPIARGARAVARAVFRLEEELSLADRKKAVRSLGSWASYCYGNPIIGCLPLGSELPVTEAVLFYNQVKKTIESLESPGSYIEKLSLLLRQSDISYINYQKAFGFLNTIVSVIDEEYDKLKSFWRGLSADSTELDMFEEALEKMCKIKKRFHEGRDLIEKVLGISEVKKDLPPPLEKGRSAFTKLSKKPHPKPAAAPSSSVGLLFEKKTSGTLPSIGRRATLLVLDDLDLASDEV